MAAITVNKSINADDIYSMTVAVQFVAVAGNPSTAAQSTPDAITWTARTLPSSSNWQSVAYGAGLAVAVSSTSGTTAASTPDAITWTARTLPATASWQAIAYGGGSIEKFVAVAGGGTTVNGYSADGVVWTSGGALPASGDWRSIAYGGGRFVTISYNSTDSAYSTTGTSWTAGGALPAVRNWQAITYGGGKFVAIAAGTDKGAYSTDGTSWTEMTLPSSSDWRSITYGLGKFVAVSSTSGTIAASSTDGITWNSRTLPTTALWNGVAFGDNKFVAVSTGSTAAASSPDGIVWTARTQVSAAYNSVCFTPFTWNSADTLTISEGAIVTVNTDQKKFWNTIAISDGKLKITNTSTSTGIRFTMGRASGAAASTITPSTGEGDIEITGNWIELGTGSGASGQTMTAPFSDYIPALWVETGSGTNIYEQWLNATGVYGDTPGPFLYNGLSAVGKGKRGKFFKQQSASAPYGPITLSSVTGARAQRRITVASTSGLYPGASIIGPGFTINSVVNRIISSTELEVNNITTAELTPNWSSVAYGNSTYVAVSTTMSNVAITSPDGVTWTTRTLPVTGNWTSVCWGGTTGLFAAVCSGTNFCATSPDGITWTLRLLPAIQNWNCVASNGTSYVAVGATTADAATTAGAYSADGITWSANVLPSAIWMAVVYGAGTSNRYVATANGNTTAWDADGAGTWTTGGTTSAVNYRSLGWNGTRFVAVSGSSTACRYSTDATSWTAGGALPTSTSTAIAYSSADALFCVVATNNSSTAATSADGTTWTTRAMGSSLANNWAGICSDGTSWVAVSNTSNLRSAAATTPDGITWTLQTGTPTATSPVCFNPYVAQLTTTVEFGDGDNGNKVPTGGKVRCPNIMITSDTPANVQTASNIVGVSMVMTNGGAVTANTCLFDESYNNFTQAESVTLTNVGFSIPFIVVECYGVNFNSVGFALQPVRRYYTYNSTGWFTRDTMYGQNIAWNYINGAVITDFNICVGGPTALQASQPTVGSPGAILTLSQTKSVTWSYVRFYSLNTNHNYQTSFNCSANVMDSSFTYFEFYGLAAFNLQTACNNNTVDNITVAEDMFHSRRALTTTGTRVANNPVTGLKLVNSTKYYFKVRSFRDWTNLTRYYEGRVVSATPFLGSKWFPQQFSAYNSAANTVTLNWVRHDPTSAVLAYEIYRGTSPGFAKDSTTRIWSTATVATVTYADTGATNGNTYYYVLRKMDGNLSGITNSSGASGQPVVTTAQNFNTGLGTIANCQGTAGETRVRIPAGSAANFLGGFVFPGLTISGGGLAANTKVVSVDDPYQITVDTAISSTFSKQTLNLGACANLYVTGTGIAIGSKVTSVDSDTQITLDRNTSGAVSGTLNFFDGYDSAEVEAYVTGAAATAANICLQSDDFTNASWVKSNMTATANLAVGPNDIPYGTAAVTTGDRLQATATNGTATQTITTVASTQYTFSVYVRTDVYAGLQSVAGQISFGTATQAFTATNSWQRVSVTFTATGVSTDAVIRINTAGQYMYAATAMVNTNGSALAPIATTTSAVTLNPASQEFSNMYAWCRSTGGAASNQGIEPNLATAPSGTLWSEIYMGTTSGFTPSAYNRVGSTITGTWTPIYLSSASDNTIQNLSQEGYGGFAGGPFLSITGASNNKFFDFSLDFGYGNASYLLSVAGLSNDNMVDDFTIKGFKNYTATSILSLANTASGLTLQNINFDSYDTPFYTSATLSMLNLIMKGVSGCNASPATTVTTWSMGSTTDGIGVAFTAVYDTIFHELFHSATTGALNLTFNASNKASKPYSIISGTPAFSNTGRLYLKTVGDSIEYIWPHEIMGVSGFRNLPLKLSGVDLGTNTDVLESLYIEYAIDTGSGYGTYKRATPANLAGESVSATNGFYIKIKITARAGMKYGTQTNDFVVGETIRGVTSGATAVVDEDVDLGSNATGTIILSSISGTFIAAELIVRDSDSQSRATNVVTNVNYALFPKVTSYINGLQIYTGSDPQDYPGQTVTITLTNVVTNSRYYIYKTVDESLVALGTASSSTVAIGGVPYTANFGVTIRVRKSSAAPKYIPLETQATVTASGASVYIGQTADTVA